MFIAARPVQIKSDIIEDKVLIFDTDDLTLEYVDSRDLRDCISEETMIKRIGNTEIVGVPSEVDIYTYINDALELAFVSRADISFLADGAVVYKKGLIKRYRSRIWYFGEYKLEPRSIFVENKDNAEFIDVTVNDKVLFEFYEADYRIHYVFKFRDYLVIRFTDRTGNPNITVILNKNSEIVCLYSSVVFLYGDKSLYMRVETTCKY